MYAVVELLGNDYWKHKPKLNEIDQTMSAIELTKEEIRMVFRLGVQNFHGYNYLATLYGRWFKLQKELNKQIKAINVGKYQAKFVALYISFTIDPNGIWPKMKEVFDHTLVDSIKNALRAARDYPCEYRDECYIDWDTVNANFKKG